MRLDDFIGVCFKNQIVFNLEKTFITVYPLKFYIVS